MKQQANTTKAYQVKTFFHGWQQVTQEQAKAFILHKFQGITTKTDAEKVAHIQSLVIGLNVAEVLRG